jgi:outer membrane protein OmpA-like peptidoglycan-associated protein
MVATSPQPTSAAPATAATVVASTSPVPTALAVPTVDPNLLATSNGTIVRSYPAAVDGDPTGAGDASQGWSVSDGAHAPYVFVFELPGRATIDRFAVDHPNVPAQGATVTISVSTTSADTGFTDVATNALTAGTPDPLVIAKPVTARWIRMTIQTPASNATAVAHLEAFGNLSARPTSPPVDGFFRPVAAPYVSGAFSASPKPDAPVYAVTQDGFSANAAVCSPTSGEVVGYAQPPQPGAFDGRVYTESDTLRHWVANDEGTLLIGTDDAYPSYLAKQANVPPNCRQPINAGSGSHNVLVIDQPYNAADPAYLYPLLAKKNVALQPYRFTRIQAAMLNRTLLASTETVLFNMVCNPDKWFDEAQKAMLLQWIAAGHKLVIHDADLCPGIMHYDFLPYHFTTSNPGANGAAGSLLLQLESDSLGSNDRSDAAHYVNISSYLADRYVQQIGDANVVMTKDPHWCGHLFGRNLDNVNGFMQMYARYGKGLIIYNGLDHNDYADPSYQRIIKLELDQPVIGDLPCTRSVASTLLLVPDRSLHFTAGKDQTVHTQLELYGNQAWHGHVTMSATGPLRVKMTPASFDLSQNEKPIQVSIDIPAGTAAGTYPVLVSANAGRSQPAQATVTLVATSSLVSEIATQKRVRIYGIHFDYDSARIQPESEPVIAQIAAAMRANRSLRFRVEGYTDSDGGFAYNMGLSQRRAQSVVDDLVTRYGIARSRLVPKGYGMTNPVAPNATDAGKALNRRVELVRI